MAEATQSPGPGAEQAEAAAAERPGPDSYAAVQLLETLPSWVGRGAIYLTVLLLAAGVAFAAVARLDVTVSCPAVIQAGQVSRLGAPGAGLVDRVLVSPGQHVHRGDPLLLFLPASAGEGDAPLPVPASADGVVLELPAGDAGAPVARGDLLCTLHPDDAGLKVELKLPNRAIGRVQPGMPVALHLDAYPSAEFGPVRTAVGAVGAVAREDPRLGWIYPVTAGLPQPWLEARGKRFELHPGMTGTAEIVVGRRSMLSGLVGGRGD